MNENELQTLREHTSGVFAVACHGGVLVASGSDDFSVKLFTSSDKNIFVLVKIKLDKFWIKNWMLNFL